MKTLSRSNEQESNEKANEFLINEILKKKFWV